MKQYCKRNSYLKTLQLVGVKKKINKTEGILI